MRFGPAGKPPPTCSNHTFRSAQVTVVSSSAPEVSGSLRTDFATPAGDHRFASPRQKDLLVPASPRWSRSAEAPYATFSAQFRNDSFSAPLLTRCPSWESARARSRSSSAPSPRLASVERRDSFSPRVTTAGVLPPGSLVRCNSDRIAPTSSAGERRPSFRMATYSASNSLPDGWMGKQTHGGRSQSVPVASGVERCRSFERSSSTERCSMIQGLGAVPALVLPKTPSTVDSSIQVVLGSARQLHRDNSCCENERLEKMRMQREWNMQRLGQAIDKKRRANARLQASPGISTALNQVGRMQSRDRFDPSSLGLLGSWAVKDEVIFKERCGDDSSSDESDNPDDCLPAATTFAVRALSPFRDGKHRSVCT